MQPDYYLDEEEQANIGQGQGDEESTRIYMRLAYLKKRNRDAALAKSQELDKENLHESF